MTEDDPARAQDALSDRLLAERDERRRLGELIHEGPVQHLAALAQMLDAAIHAAEGDDTARTLAISRRALEVAREASADLRDIVAGIEPATLESLGLAAALDRLAQRIRVRRGIAVTLDLSAERALGARARVGVYQVVREALEQASRRGPPTRIEVALRAGADGGVELTITDDGARERRQAVIDGLAERVVSLGGTLELDRAHAPGTTIKGTTIRVTLPPSGATR